MLTAVALAACAAWHAEVVGHYRGDVRSTGAQSAETWIEETEKGLAGRFLLHENGRDVEGVLEPLGDEGCHIALFHWRDRYGEGQLRLQFFPARQCFEGYWGRERPDPALIYSSCPKAPVTS